MTTLTEPQAALLRGKNFANLATIRADGTPHVTPVWVDFDGEHVLMNTAAGRAKWQHMRRDPRVGIEVFDTADPYSYVSMTGTVVLEEAGADEQIGDLAEKYRGSRDFDMRGETRVIVRFTPDRIGGNV